MSKTEQEVKVMGKRKELEHSRMKVKKIAFIGLMGAVSAVLMLLRFPIPFMPPFNLIKYGATSVVTFIIYKRLRGVIRGIIAI